MMQTVLTTKKVVPGLAHEKRKLKIEKLTNIATSEVILQPSQTYMANHSCRNSQQLKVVNYFRRKTPPQKFFWAPHTSLYLTWLIFQKSASAMVPGLAHKNYFLKQHIVKKKDCIKK